MRLLPIMAPLPEIQLSACPSHAMRLLPMAQPRTYLLPMPTSRLLTVPLPQIQPFPMPLHGRRLLGPLLPTSTLLQPQPLLQLMLWVLRPLQLLFPPPPHLPDTPCQQQMPQKLRERQTGA